MQKLTKGKRPRAEVIVACGSADAACFEGGQTAADRRITADNDI